MKNDKLDLSTAITDTLQDLYLQAGDEGEAIIPTENYCDNFETLAPEKATVTVKLRWTEGDREEVVIRAGHLINAICRLAKEPNEVLSPDLKTVYETYIEGFETGIAGRNEPDGDEAAQFQKHRAAHADDAACRVGEGPYAYAVLMRAGRLYRLFKLDAPQTILRHEVALLTQALALHANAV